MIGKGHSLSRATPGLLALLLMLVLAGTGKAEILLFRNDTRMPVIVHVVSVFNGVITRERPHLLNPKSRTPAIKLPGDKIITIHDGNTPTRILYQGTLPASLLNRSYSIIPDMRPLHVRIKLRTGMPKK
jgi:hypothetical protein